VVCARVPSVHLDRIVEDADALAAFAVRARADAGTRG
jgi:hypothetical protein